MKPSAVALLLLLLLLRAVSPALAADAPRGSGPSVQRRARKPGPARGARSRGRTADLSAFVRALRARGLTVESAGEVSQPFFKPGGHAYTVAGENVQVFRYPSASAAEAEAKQVNAEGTSAGTNAMMWVGPPHFFRKGRLVVIYVGENAGVLEALTSVLGPQFAGK